MERKPPLGQFEAAAQQRDSRAKSKMKLYPLQECADRAEKILAQNPHAQCFQQFKCAHCGVKQTMPDANKFYIGGCCEECGRITDIQKTGCNYAVHYTVDGSELASLLDTLTKKD
jgi:hypothetical protein